MDLAAVAKTQFLTCVPNLNAPTNQQRTIVLSMINFMSNYVIWKEDYNFDPGTNVVDVYIQRIRKKVDGEFPEKLIETIRGVGYRIRPASS